MESEAAVATSKACKELVQPVIQFFLVLWLIIPQILSKRTQSFQHAAGEQGCWHWDVAVLVYPRQGAGSVLAPHTVYIQLACWSHSIAWIFVLYPWCLLVVAPSFCSSLQPGCEQCCELPARLSLPSWQGSRVPSTGIRQSRRNPALHPCRERGCWRLPVWLLSDYLKVSWNTVMDGECMSFPPLSNSWYLCCFITWTSYVSATFSPQTGASHVSSRCTCEIQRKCGAFSGFHSVEICV